MAEKSTNEKGIKNNRTEESGIINKLVTRKSKGI
jgi:hypothetical protein